ncbi:MAG: CpaF family protein [Candidatus Micrarchaeota archaeon]|nr:CpaF family protein [Candidatus Micrarchaeota archaeon]MDE1859377.1 CpaF family protein [Candidatus Micrarchaeota archaeon]
MADAPTTTEVVKEFASYSLNASGVEARIRIVDRGGYVPNYEVSVPGLGEATKILLLSLRNELLNIVPVDMTRITEHEYVTELNKRYINASSVMIDRYLPGTRPEIKAILIAYIINIMLGLGDLEVLVADENLEEIAVNSSKEPVWIFHKKFGWCKTNIKLYNEEAIYDLSEAIGRRVGRQITMLSPLMDAELTDGSRVNATLYPVSQGGDTITIRKFSKNPWTMPALIASKSLSAEVAAIIWICVQNEISLVISGGTASGKTSFLNAMSIFMPSNHRVISIEETRELTLPSFLQWVPMLTRQPNAEGKGEITLYNLMINALRQRPDIMLVGEIRTKYDAQTLFEAIHTGHAVYGTIHADNVQDTVVRMTNPPIDIPKVMLNSIGGVISLFRHRRLGIRRVLEFGEMLGSGDTNVLYRWNLRGDSFAQISNLSRLAEVISLYGGYTYNELLDDINEKASILTWMVNNKVTGVNEAGNTVAQYYKNKERVIKIVKDNVPFSEDLLK